MTLYDAAELLQKMRENAPHGEKSIQAILFAIKYHDEIQGMSFADLSSLVGAGPNTCAVELEYGVKLSKYVTILRD